MSDENKNNEEQKDVNVDPFADKSPDLAEHARKLAEEEAAKGASLEEGSLRSTHEGKSFKDKLGDVLGEKINTTATKSTFPLHQALAFSWQGIRLRLGRMTVVLMGVSLAIAFCAFLLASSGFSEQLGPNAGVTEDQKSFRVWWIVIAVTIAFVGITNAVMMSVTERIKEIGTIKCLGACDYHIISIFIFETILLGVLGGVIGALLGYGLAAGVFLQQYSGVVPVKYMNDVSFTKELMVLPKAITISVVISLIASFVPVMFAAKVEPAEAMRYEV